MVLWGSKRSLHNVNRSRILKRNVMEFNQLDMQSLRRNQWIKKEELNDIQFRRLKALLLFAFKNIPFHHYNFGRMGISPDEIKNQRELVKLSPMSKEDLDMLGRQIFPSGRKRRNSIREISTSGTTGFPSKVYEDEKTARYRFLIRRRANEAIRIELWDKIAKIFFTYPKPVSNQMKLVDRIKLSLSKVRQHYTRAFYITYSCSEIINELQRFEPDVIEAQPAYLVSLKNDLGQNSKITPKALISNGSLLSKPVKRELESFFGAPVYDFYGSREFGLLAWQCNERNEYHLNSDTFFFEFVRDGNPCSPGERGSLLVTSLINYTMPLIRYEVGDTVVLGDNDCACGRSLPTIKSIEGRNIEFLHLADGSIVSPRSIINSLDGVRDIPPYQLVCMSADEAIIKIFERKVDELLISNVLSRLQEITKGQMKFNVQFVQEEPRAKIRTIIPFESAAIS